MEEDPLYWPSHGRKLPAVGTAGFAGTIVPSLSLSTTQLNDHDPPSRETATNITERERRYKRKQCSYTIRLAFREPEFMGFDFVACRLPFNHGASSVHTVCIRPAAPSSSSSSRALSK